MRLVMLFTIFSRRAIVKRVKKYNFPAVLLSIVTKCDKTKIKRFSWLGSKNLNILIKKLFEPIQ